MHNRINDGACRQSKVAGITWDEHSRYWKVTHRDERGKRQLLGCRNILGIAVKLLRDYESSHCKSFIRKSLPDNPKQPLIPELESDLRLAVEQSHIDAYWEIALGRIR